MNFENIILKSSNAYKISEYTRLLKDHNIKIEKGQDLQEVMGTMDEVIIYKALEAGENVLVEDAIIFIDGKEEVEIKWKWKDLKDNQHVKWVISLGIVQNGVVTVFRGYTEAIVDTSFTDKGEVFEPFIVSLKNNPDKLNYSTLSKVINKDIIDPRAMAVKKLISNDFEFQKDIFNIPVWNGTYQND